MSQVDNTGRVYISNSEIASNSGWLRKSGITHIVNCASELPNYFPNKFGYYRTEMHDIPSETIINRVEAAFKFISETLRRDPNAKILIHCHMGISRSASVAIYYLMRRYGVSFKYAMSLLKSRHSVTNPNVGYASQLQYLCNKLGGACNNINKP
jgi:protein-tyrosine phosphatase